MRLRVTIVMVLIGVGFGLTGCSTAREPIVIIAPSYSYVQADLASSLSSYSPTRPADTSTIAKLPPLPPAPFFDPMVYRGLNLPINK